MSIFGSIRDAIFGHKASTPQPAPPAQAPGQTSAMPQMQAPAAPQQVDVEEVLLSISAGKGDPDLNWRSSIVDLMKLLDLDSSLANRQELAGELGYAGEKNGSAEMNIWLHKAVMQALEKNGGIVPAAMKD